MRTYFIGTVCFERTTFLSYMITNHHYYKNIKAIYIKIHMSITPFEPRTMNNNYKEYRASVIENRTSLTTTAPYKTTPW
ncbi:hypothetical protein SAMN04488130_1252 [Flavobacterium urumqiense]|uniref:Uncharacterized protein n=1 Tax=Flavobacterium urumqiense TaxID=935224 RepID=A0A1H6AVH7_9FLAO|nr:hypothetical protein SAMN04488130_1252 [Flavobacterium urumqiense]